MSAIVACSAPARSAPSARRRRERRQVFGLLAVLLCVVWQAGVSCHAGTGSARHHASSSATDIDALIAAQLCSAGGLKGAPLAPDDSPAGSDPSDTGAGCLHCASGGCHGGQGAALGGRPSALFAALVVGVVTASRGKSGALLGITGHPPRGPPSAGL